MIRVQYDDQYIHLSTKRATTFDQSNSIPKKFSVFNQHGWALRVHKPSFRIDQRMKDYIQRIHHKELSNGRKIPPEEYVLRIRAARNLDGSKLFLPSQYLTILQVREAHISSGSLF